MGLAAERARADVDAVGAAKRGVRAGEGRGLVGLSVARRRMDDVEGRGGRGAAVGGAVGGAGAEASLRNVFFRKPLAEKEGGFAVYTLSARVDGEG